MKKHSTDLYITLLYLSRKLYFYNKIKLKDTFETRIYLMFMHFSILLIIFKNKKINFPQDTYDSLFHYIENNLRELGFGDVAVNKKMKDFNKVSYDILLKIKINKDKNIFQLNQNLIQKYFDAFKDNNFNEFKQFEDYLKRFYDFCFELPLENMIRDVNKFK